MTCLIEVSSLSKKFGNFTAVKDISFTIETGEVFGLVGPNGAGKSTIVKILCTILEPTSGSCVIKGMDIRKNAKEIRSIIGYLPEEPRVYDYMTATEYVRLFARMYGAPDSKIFELFDYFNVVEHKDRLMGDLSKGLRQRISIVRALVHEPEILLLDEPTMGLDPASARELREKIFELKKNGKTIVLCTHYMEEADFLCDTVGIINNGRLIACDTPERLKHSLKRNREIGVIFSKTRYLKQDKSFKEPLSKETLKKHGRAHVFSGSTYEEILERISSYCDRNFLKIEKIYSIEPTLEDVFVNLVKRSENEKKS